MQFRKAAVLVAVGAVAVIVGALFLFGKGRDVPAVTVTLRVSVAPSEQADFAAGQAKSARFKYLAGKLAGVKSVLAQKLSVKSVPNSALLEAQLGVESKEQGERYADGFAETLQLLCGKTATIAMVERSVR